MKKIFWTSIVWILIFVFFLAYMRFSNNHLANKFCSILDWNKCSNIEIEQNLEEEILDIDEDAIIEDVSEIEDIIVDEIDEKKDNADRDKLFEQLDRIENVVGKNSGIEKSEEELFDEFKTWYNQKKE